MKRQRFSEEQIIGILRESEAGVKNQDLCRKHGITQQTFYRWRSKYGWMEVSEAKNLKELKAENRKLKQLLAEAHLDTAVLPPEEGSGKKKGSNSGQQTYHCHSRGVIMEIPDEMNAETKSPRIADNPSVKEMSDILPVIRLVNKVSGLARRLGIKNERLDRIYKTSADALEQSDVLTIPEPIQRCIRRERMDRY